MAKTLDIAVKVTDAASQPLKSITQSLKGAGMAASSASKKFAKLDSTFNSNAAKNLSRDLGKLESNVKSIREAATALNKVSRASNKVGANSKIASKGMSKVGTSAKRSSRDITEFNRSLFATTAFVGIFAKASAGLSSGLMEAADMDRVTNSFEKAFGPRGDFIKHIQNTTDNSIDLMESMRAGISFSALGIETDMKSMADIMIRAGTAAKLAGKDSGEGIKAFAKFMKEGSISHLEFLNLIKSTDTNLMLSESLLSRYGGVMGKVMTISQRMALAQNVLRKTTEGALKGQKDYKDILLMVSEAFMVMRSESFKLLLQSFGPMIDKTKDLIWQFSNFVETTRSSSKEIMFLVKTFAAVTAGAAGLFAVVGTLRLALFALGTFSVGIPFVVTLLTGLGLSFLGITNKVDKFEDKLKVFGAVFKGTFQLVKSFLSVTDNYKRGIGEIDKSTADLLRKNGLFEFVVSASKGLSVFVNFLSGFVEGFKFRFNEIVSVVSNTVNKVMKFFGSDSIWSRKPLDFAKDFGKEFGKASVIILGLLGSLKLLGGAKKILKKIPFIGKLFGGGMGSAHKGTSSDPIYVRIANMLGTAAAAMPSGMKSTLSTLTKTLGGLGLIIAAGMTVKHIAESKTGKNLFESYFNKVPGAKNIIPDVKMKDSNKRRFPGQTSYTPPNTNIGSLGAGTVKSNRVPLTDLANQIETVERNKNISQEVIKERLQAVQNKLVGQQKQRFTESFVEAQQQSSQSGTIITPQEMRQMLSDTIGSKIQMTNNHLKNVDDKVQKPKSKVITSRNGGC